MKRRSFLAMLGLAPVAGVAAAKGLVDVPVTDAAIGGNAAGAPLKWEVVSGPYGCSRTALTVCAPDSPAPKATLFMDIPADAGGPTRHIFRADKFAVTDRDGAGFITIEER